MFRVIALLLLSVVALAALYLALWPVPIDPVAWQPPPAPKLAGPYAVNRDLVAHRRLLEQSGRGPEDIAFDAAGFLYTGFENGRIVRIPAAGGEPEVYADTGGRPNGMVFDAAGNLLVADGLRGLLRVAPDRSVETLATEADGVSFGLADDLDVAPDGTVYFTDASSKFGMATYQLDILEHGGHGRLIAYDAADGTARVVLEGLQFANGVVVARDGSFVLVAETGAYGVRRLWLAGPKAGTDEPFNDNLPGFPDNISLTDRGTLWVALYMPRAAQLDAAATSPFMRKLMLRLPASVRAAPPRYGMVVELGPGGEPLRSLHDPAGAIANVTSVMERGGELFLGSNLESSIAVVPMASAVAAGTVAK